MNNTTPHNSRFNLQIYLVILALLIIGIIAQGTMYIGWDVGWHLQVTRRFLQGGRYVSSFMDMNPPILIYTLIPAVLLNKFTGLSLAVSTKIYVFGLGLFCLYFCHYYCTKLFVNNKKSHLIIIAIIALIYFILPCYEFAQREHFALLLLMPYFLQSGLGRKIHFNKSTAILSSILAGIGFCVNFQFIAIFVAVELYLLSTNRRWRTESSIILTVLAAYLFSIFILTPNYFHIMLPILKLLYFSSFDYSWHAIFNNAATIPGIISFVLGIIIFKKIPQRQFFTVMLIALLLFMAQFIVTRKIWYYHMLPPLAISLIILALIIINTKQSSLKNMIILGIAITCVILGPIKSMLSSALSGYIYAQNPRSSINTIIRFVKHHQPNSPFYVFSTTVHPAGMLVNYPGLTLGSRFASQWMLPGIVQLEHKTLNDQQERRLFAAKTLVLSIVSHDFSNFQPKLVFVDHSKIKKYFKNGQFNYLHFFKQNADFAKLWTHYKKVGDVGRFTVYAYSSSAINKKI